MFILLLLLIQRTVAEEWCASVETNPAICPKPDSCKFTEAEAEACYDDSMATATPTFDSSKCAGGEAMRSCYEASSDSFVCSTFEACGVCCSGSVLVKKCAGTHTLNPGTTCTLDHAVNVYAGATLTITGDGSDKPIISGDTKTNHFNVFGNLVLTDLILQDGTNSQFDGGSINAIRIGAAKPSVTLLGTTLKANKASKKYGSEEYDLAESKNPFNSPGRGGKSDLFSLIHKLYIYLTLSSFLFFFFFFLYF